MNRNREILGRVGKGVAALSVGALVAGGARTSQAAPVYVDVDISFTGSPGATSPVFDVNADSVGDFALSETKNSLSAPSRLIQFQSIGGATADDPSLQAFPFDLAELISLPIFPGVSDGMLINVTADTSNNAVLEGGLFVNLPAPKFVGFSFLTPQGEHAAWVELNVEYAAELVDPVVHISAWGYETEPNTPIAAGVPEPSGLALMALGAAGLAAYRRRKRQSLGAMPDSEQPAASSEAQQSALL